MKTHTLASALAFAEQQKQILQQASLWAYYRANLPHFVRHIAYFQGFTPLKSMPHLWQSNDLHLENIGYYPDTSNGVWAINDFDEAALSPFILDPLRLACSIALLPFFSHSSQETALRATLQRGFIAYQEVLFSAEFNPSILSHSNPLAQHGLMAFLPEALESQSAILERLVHIGKDKTAQLICNKTRRLKLHKSARHALLSTPNATGQILDIVFRIAGLASLGRPRFLALMQSENTIYNLQDWKIPSEAFCAHWFPTERKIAYSPAAQVYQAQKMLQGHIAQTEPHVITLNNGEQVLARHYPIAQSLAFSSITEQKLMESINDLFALCAMQHLRACANGQGSASLNVILDYLRSMDCVRDWSHLTLRVTDALRIDWKKSRNIWQKQQATQ
jgi:uncharacterized protein (DUF2252 family)